MGGINTGKGGFEIDGKVYDLDPGDPSAPGTDFGEPDSGDIKVDNTRKDISKKTKTTLSKYLSDSTLGKHDYSKGTPNKYPVSSEQVEFSISDAKGFPPVLEESVNSPQFVKRSDIVSGYADVPADKRQSGPEGGRHGRPTVEDAIDALGDLGRGKSLGKPVDGNTLLPNVSKDNPGPVVGGYTSKVLSNNRFTSNVLMSTDQSYRIAGRDYTGDQLKAVGAMLSLRGSQEFPAAFNQNVNPQNAGSVAGALLPSPNQLGILKVSKVLLEARDALEHLADNADAPTSITISPLGDQSWGALNNVEEPWSGTLNLGMVAMALAMQSTLLLAFEGLGALVGVISGGGAAPNPSRNASGAYTLGSYLSNPSKSNKAKFPPDIKALLGIHGTRFPFGDALKTGTAAFFVGADKAKDSVGNQLLGALTSAATNVLSDNTSAGYIIVVSRQIIRTGQTIAAQIEKIASAFASNPISGINGILGLLDIIKQSKLISAINVFTTLGDAILSEDTFSKDDTSTSTSIVSTIDAIHPDIVGANVKKNRLSKLTNEDGSLMKLAWASNRAPASYLIPDSVATMALIDSKLGSFKGPMGIIDPDTRSVVFVQKKSDRELNGARIPLESSDPKDVDVKKMESALEAEYMPFYFHDLRTNEIIGFQAFLVSLSDDYTANWESIDGYGRVDPIKIYKSTSRRISMSFFVIATDEKDFDEMWIKLNKLTTLVYPQYTKGRLLSDGKTSFVQPFSQLIGASPLIRIRLGDLIRSNYSRFALARLFGAADGDMKLETGKIEFEGAEAISDKVKNALKNAISDKSNSWHLTTTNWASAMASNNAGISLSFGGSSKPDQAPSLNIDAGDLPYFTFTVKTDKRLPGGMVAIEPKIMKAPDIVDTYGYTLDAATRLVDGLNARYNSDKNPKSKVVGGTSGYAVPAGMLKLTSESFKKIFSENSQGPATTNIQNLANFLDIEKNALVKSFRAIQGKGLGGVIESMNFDWYDKATWEIKPDSRAPKMCKVTIAFAPIHDISPGIDHMGYNRSPVYPVGNTMGMGPDPDKKG